MYVPLLLLYHTGMRLGEILGLTWQDVDFEQKQINLRRQVRYLGKRGDFFTTLKTESSNRYILIGDFLLSELARWRQRQIDAEQELAEQYIYTYCKSDGQILRQSKAFPPEGERVQFACTRRNGESVKRSTITRV